MNLSNPAIITNFRNQLTEEEKSPLTIEKYSRDVSIFLNWCQGKLLSKNTVLQYKQELMNHYAATTVNSVLSSLNSFFIRNNLEHLKTKNIRLQNRTFFDQCKELTKEEYERLLSTALHMKKHRLFLILQTICSTGIRVSELKYITVSAIEKGYTTVHCKAKIRMVILPDKLCNILSSYCNEKQIKSGSVFISNRGNPLDRSNIWSEMKELCDKAQVPCTKVFPHNLRHLFARTYYSCQNDVVRLADILGHSNINTTRIYTMESGEIHRNQIQNLGLIR